MPSSLDDLITVEVFVTVVTAVTSQYVISIRHIRYPEPLEPDTLLTEQSTLQNMLAHTLVLNLV